MVYLTYLLFLIAVCAIAIESTVINDKDREIERLWNIISELRKEIHKQKGGE